MEINKCLVQKGRSQQVDSSGSQRESRAQKFAWRSMVNLQVVCGCPERRVTPTGSYRPDLLIHSTPLRIPVLTSFCGNQLMVRYILVMNLQQLKSSQSLWFTARPTVTNNKNNLSNLLNYLKYLFLVNRYH